MLRQDTRRRARILRSAVATADAENVKSMFMTWSQVASRCRAQLRPVTREQQVLQNSCAARMRLRVAPSVFKITASRTAALAAKRPSE